MANSSLCDIIRKIQANPLAKVEGMTIGTFYALKEHLESCVECSEIVDNISEKYKDVPSDPNSDWNKTKYN